MKKVDCGIKWDFVEDFLAAICEFRSKQGFLSPGNGEGPRCLEECVGISVKPRLW